ncbi:MAG: ATP-binding protein [Desulfobacula sp.]|nr:ATP-binding protein [Desulfobacula sp.]
MKFQILNIRSLAFKLLIPVGLVLFSSIFFWTHFSTKYEEKILLEKVVSDVDKFCNSVLNFTWFAMLHNPNEDMQDVLKSMSAYNDIEQMRIYSVTGEIKFSNSHDEIGKIAQKDDIACKLCHSEATPVIKPDLSDRVRMFESKEGKLLLGVINPIMNEPDCSSSQCHYHPKSVKKLGVLDVVVSLESINHDIQFKKKMSAWTAVYLFMILSITICVIIFFRVTYPINRLIKDTGKIATGDYFKSGNHIYQQDEIGNLALAINDMGGKIHEKQTELNQQKDMYQNLFEQVPCTITVQNRDYELIGFNQEFAKKFNPEYGDYCYAAYKGLSSKCINCPVEKTFEDGFSHFSEESGVNKDGSIAHWVVKTAPLMDEKGDIVAAMEMSIDVSQKKDLEEKVKISEKKYQAIFKNIPNPVFILDKADLNIIDCNDSVLSAYGYNRLNLMDHSMEILFQDRSDFEKIKKNIHHAYHERIVNIRKDQSSLFVNIWISPARFVNDDVWIMTVVDITISVETEQQLIQAGKMATLGEMATGVAHELNQPLSVIKTASSFISKKLTNSTSPIDQEILKTLSDEIETHVDRAAKITNHMRLFGRKSVFQKEEVNINEVLTHAFDIFSQQLKLREIEVCWFLDETNPTIHADPVRLEQVFINLLINARDAIVAKDKKSVENQTIENKIIQKQIILTTSKNNTGVIAAIKDSGIGLSNEEINKIFEPFFTTKKVGEGTGLGLSISYGIIKEFGGEINVQNNKMGGATFTILFKSQEINHG